MRPATSGCAAKMARRRGGCGRGSVVGIKLAMRSPASIRRPSAGCNASVLMLRSSFDPARTPGSIVGDDCAWSSREGLELIISTASAGTIATFSKDEVTKSGGKIFFIDPMHLVDMPAREFDRPPHPLVVLQNPAKFNLLDRTQNTAPTQFGNEYQNDRDRGAPAMQRTP